MKKIAIINILLLVILSSCDESVVEYSENLKEQAIVVTTIYSPSTHDVSIKKTAYSDNEDVIGTDYDGNEGVKIGKNHQITTSTIPEKFGVAFQCQHGTFTIEGEKSKYKVLRDKLASHVDDTVTIIYRQKYNVVYGEDKDGKRIEKSRVLIDLDFIDAQL